MRLTNLVHGQSLCRHGERTLERLVPPDEPRRVHEDATLDPAQLVQRGVPDSAPRRGQRLAVLKRTRSRRNRLDPPVTLVILVQRVLGQRVRTALTLELEQVLLPRAVARQLQNLTRRVHILRGIHRRFDVFSRREPRETVVLHRVVKLNAGERHSLGELRHLRRRGVIFIPRRVELTHARAQVGVLGVLRGCVGVVHVHAVVDAVHALDE